MGEGRIARSWRLTRTALGLVRGEPAMRLLGVLVLLAIALGVVALFGVAYLLGWPDGGQSRLALATAIVVFPTTLISSFLSTAVVAVAAARLESRRLGAGEALRFALARLDQIVLWSLLAAGVGYLLQEVIARLPFGGQVVSFLGGLAWQIVSVFAIPVLVLEGCRGTACLRRSASVVRGTWGEAVGGTVAIGAWTALVAIPAGLLIGLGIGVANFVLAPGLAVAAAGVVLLLATVTVAALTRDVFALVLYRYAVDGERAPGFDPADLERPFTPRRRWFGG